MTSQRTLWVFYLIVWEQVTRVCEARSLVQSARGMEAEAAMQSQTNHATGVIS